MTSIKSESEENTCRESKASHQFIKLQRVETTKEDEDLDYKKEKRQSDQTQKGYTSTPGNALSRMTTNHGMESNFTL